MIHFEHIPNDILLYIEKLQQALHKDDNVVFAYLFGGLAKGAVSPLSDVDIAIYVNRVEDMVEYKMKLFVMLSEILHTSEIDIVILNTAPESITGRILLNKKLLVDKNPHKRHIYESLTLRKYFDFSIKEKQILFRRYGIGRYSSHP